MGGFLGKTGERAVPDDFDSVEEYLSFLRHLFAYEYVIDSFPTVEKWLDIGCGEGYGTALISEHVGSIVGIDTNVSAIDHASGKYNAENCCFLLYDGNRSPFEDESFDMVISFQVIEHIRDDRQFIGEIRRLLKPGGRAVLTTPNRTYRLRPGQKPWNPYHIREYYPEEFRAVLNSSFTDVTVYGIKGKGGVQEIETAAVTKGFQYIDRLNIRHHIPAPIKPVLSKLARFLTGRRLDRKNLDTALESFSTSDYCIVEESLETSLDLMGICRK